MNPKPPFTDLQIATQDSGFYKGYSLPIALLSKLAMAAAPSIVKGLLPLRSVWRNSKRKSMNWKIRLTFRVECKNLKSEWAQWRRASADVRCSCSPVWWTKCRGSSSFWTWFWGEMENEILPPSTSWRMQCYTEQLHLMMIWIPTVSTADSKYAQRRLRWSPEARSCEIGKQVWLSRYLIDSFDLRPSLKDHNRYHDLTVHHRCGRWHWVRDEWPAGVKESMYSAVQS